MLTNTYKQDKKRDFGRLAQKKSFDEIEREAIQDGILTDQEVKEMLAAYDRENFERDKKLLRKLSAYDYDIWIDPHYKINIAKAREDPKPVEPLAPTSVYPFHILYQKQLFLVITGTAAIICLMGLLL